MVLLGVFAFSFQVANIPKTVETVALPVTNKTIILDARTSEFQMKEHKVEMEQQKPKQI